MASSVEICYYTVIVVNGTTKEFAEMKRLVLTTVSLVLALALSATTALGQSARHGRLTSTRTVASAQPAKVALSSSRLGRVLVDSQGRTLYLFEKDKRGRSACAGTCATYWPPLLTHGKPTADQGIKGSLLGITHRAGGEAQVTYAGHPLYRFVQDTRAGQTNGQDSQEFGAGWYVVSPAGKKIGH